MTTQKLPTSVMKEWIIFNKIEHWTADIFIFELTNLR